MIAPRYEELLAERPAAANRLAEAAPLPTEIELQAAWFAGAFGRRFRSCDGREVEIVQFGHWNHAAGPDFVDAVVRVAGGEPRRGAIELDPSARDWELHGHSGNPAYNGVVLHLFFAAGGARFFTRTSDHREVPQVLLDAAVLEAAPERAEAEARTGRCAAPLAQMDSKALDTLLDAAARHRMARKSAACARYASAHNDDEALFAGIAEALGYRRNRLPMRVLAGRLPLRRLRKAGAPGAEALLFGGAGFLDTPAYESAPPETRDYLRGLWQEWWKHRAGFDPQRTPAWGFAGSRPSNHPHRRLAALACLVARWRNWSRLAWADPLDPDAIIRFLAGLEHPYWGEHYTLSSARSASPQRLVGAARASDILANVLLPMRLPQSPGLWEVYKSLPAGLGNQKLRRAAKRLFGDDAARAKAVQKHLFAQQALLQIYDDFCMADESDCAKCPFPEQLGQWS